MNAEQMSPAPTVSSERLLGCPFCGHEAEYRANPINELLTMWGISCKHCSGCVKKLYTDPNKAAAAWNRRQPNARTEARSGATLPPVTGSATDSQPKEKV